MSVTKMIVAKDLEKKYDDVPAVNGISFSINKGECYGFLGPNGAGKTTTIRIINCMSPLTSGNVLVNDWHVRLKPREIKNLIGVVPQEENLDPDLTVLNNLLVYARYFEIPKNEATSRAEELLHFFTLDDKKKSHINELSGGMKRRLLIARALINKPEILILDEPTTGLDPQVRHAIWQRLRSLKKDGMTILLTTHYMDEASQLCDRIAIMDKGKILLEGNPIELVREQIGKEVIELRINNEKEKELLEKLGRFEFTHDRAGDTLYLFSGDGRELLQFLVSNNYELVLHRPASLEDLFLKLTGRGLNE